MASLHTLRSLGASQPVFPTPFSSDDRTTGYIGFQRKSEQCWQPAAGLQSRPDYRLNKFLTTKSSASSPKFDGMSRFRCSLPQTIVVEPKASASQLYGTEAFHEESPTVTTSSPSMLGTVAPTSISSFGGADQKPSVPSRVITSSEQSNASETSRFLQMQTMGQINSTHQIKPVDLMRGGVRPDLQSSLHEKSMIESQNQGYYSPPFDEMGQIKSMEAFPSREFYSPKSGDLVLGVVTQANDLELTVEIGSRVPALITMREFRPAVEVVTNSFFKLPLDDDSNETDEGFVVPPAGKGLLVGDPAAHGDAQYAETVKIGTIFVAEVLNSAMGETRPLLTCRRLSERLVFLRMEQIMKTGEPIKFEITQYNDGGLQGSLEGLRAFLPKSELLARPENTAALQDYVGKTLTVSVVKLEHHLSNVIVSEMKLWMSENVLLGSVHDLLVTKLFPYGLQVEILDTRVRGFIHITSITRGFVMSVYTFFTEGDVIRGMVIKGRKPGQLSFCIAALEPPDEDGLVLKQRERVYDGAEEVAKLSPEYQLPSEERQIFARPSSPTATTFQDKIANLPWLHLETFTNSS